MDWEPELTDEDPALGEPVAELRGLGEAPPPAFLARVAGSINRRVLTADALDLSLRGLCQAFFEYLSAMISSLGEPGGRRKEP